MKQIPMILLISSQLAFTQNFIFKSDTIKTNFDGILKNTIIFKNNIYCFTETENNSYSNVQTSHFYKIDLSGKSTKIVVPKELQQLYIDLYSKKDSLFAVEYWDKNTFYLDIDQNKWTKANRSEDIIYEDKEYLINSADFGEFGGYTWFENKRTKKQYGIQHYFNVGLKFNGNFILTNSQLVVKVQNPEKLRSAIIPYGKYNIEKDESRRLVGKIIESEFISENFQTIFREEEYFEPEINIFSSFLTNGELYFIYLRNKQETIGQLKSGEFEDVYKFNNELDFYQHHYDYRNSINNNTQNIQFRTPNEYLKGIIEINDNILTTYYIQNLNITPILSSEKALEWFKKSFTFYSNNLRQLKYKDVENFEKKINAFPILLGKGLNTYRTKEENNIVLTKEYYFSNETDKIKHITFYWDFRHKPEFEYDEDKIGIISNKKASEIIIFLTQSYGNPKSIEKYKDNKSSYIWETKERKIDLFISNKRVAVDIENK